MFGLFKRYDVEMSPQIQGRITDNGTPVSGIKVTRSLSYEGFDKGKEQLEYTTTNNDGQFYFTEKTIKSRKPSDIVGQNMRVKQSIYVEREDQLFSLWFARKIWKPIKPLSDLLLQLNCDLQAKEVQHEIDTSKDGGVAGQVVISICHWQGESISSYYNNELISSYDDLK
ncbi:MAG: carboxypeptidase regulatory-like domain-containing protein [Psychromonas sp.]|nr:carboxypeptidase regulatory-like domain-containing protein [Psychromonas sp.]